MLSGKGILIWMLDRCGDPVGLAEMIQSAGFDWVSIKLQDYTTLGDGVVTKDGNDHSVTIDYHAYVNALRARGIVVCAWGYVYGSDPIQEAAATVRIANEFEIEYWMIDAETEYKKVPGARASAYCNEILRSIPRLKLGLCSYRFPKLHGDFPWASFLPYVSFHAPQMYWEGAHDAGDELRKSYQQLLALKEIPYIPIGSCYPAKNWTPTASDMRDFYAVVQELGLTAWGYYEYYYMRLWRDIWNEISSQGDHGTVGSDLSGVWTKIGQLEERLKKVESWKNAPL